jgi:colanic acid biosynthesis glycosyl transferase WcaI
MRILLLAQYFAPEVGATQVRLAAFCHGLRAEGHEVEVVTAMPHHPAGQIFPEYRGRFYRREIWEGITVHRLWLYTAKGRGAKRILTYLSFACLCLFGVLRAQRPDYVFVDSPPLFLAVPGWIASCIWRVPFIFNVADLWPDSVLDLGVMRESFVTKMGFALENWAYKRADFVTAVTEGVRGALLNQKRVPAKKILFMPNGVDTRLFQPNAAPDEELSGALGVRGKLVVLYAGNHGYANGLEQVILAAGLIADRRVHFLFVGDGPDKDRLQALAQDLALTNVTFVESVPIERLGAFLSISAVAVVTLQKSRITRGARPAKTFVMMAAAKPIVLAAEGESAELVRQAKAGLVVPPNVPQQLASAILLLLENPELASRLGANGRVFVETHFDWSLLIRNWLAELQRSVPSVQLEASERTQKSIAPGIS